MPNQPRPPHGGESKKRSRWKKVIAWLTLKIFTIQPLLASAQVVADPNAGQNRPTVESTANGTPIVQITKPSAAGVSRNQYDQFSVDPQGVILNNATGVTQTQLAGYVDGNANLGGTSARIILNEVTSSNPSYLRGYTEVAGQKAQVIIANANGIYGDGFGFINTSRATLTTGTPIFGGNGSLEAFRVTGGQIAIDGQGMDGSSVDQVDLISRATTVNAGIWAKKLNVVTGSNQVDYKTLGAQKIEGDGNTPQVAIDVGSLGGMYANKIFLVGTENGVGVNSRGTLSAIGGDITITNEGKVMLSGNTSATGNILIQAKDGVINQGTLYAQSNANLTTQSNIDNSGIMVAGQNTVLTAQNITSTGTIGAGINTDGSVGTTGDLTLTAVGMVTTHGQNLAGDNLVVNAAAIDLSGSNTYAGGSVNLDATAGNIDHTGAVLETDGALIAVTTGSINNGKDAQGQAGDITAAHITLNADAISNRGGTIIQLGQEATNITATQTIDNSGGIIATNGESLQMTAQAMDNSQGQIQHAGIGELTVQVTTDLANNGGQIVSNGRSTLTARNINNSQGNIITKKSLDLITQGSFTNNQGLLAGDAVNITAQGTIQNNRGVIEASKGLELDTQSLTNQSGSITSLDASGMKVAVAEDIDNTSGLIGGNGNVAISIQNMSNQGGQVSAQGDLHVTATINIENNGIMIAGQNTTLNAQDIVSNGTIGAGINADGSIGSAGDLTITADGTVTIHGRNLVGGNLDINTGVIDLSTSNTYAGGNVNLAATVGNIDHTGAALQTNGTLTATATGAIKNDKDAQGAAGNITASLITLNADAISNRGGSIIQIGQADTNITVNQTIDNSGGQIASNGGNIRMIGSALDNSKGQIQHAGTGILDVQTTADFNNSDGQIAANSQIAIHSQNINNIHGTVISQKNINLTGQNLKNSEGIIAGETLIVTAQGAVENTQGILEASKGLEIDAQSLTNQSGSITSLDASGLTVDVTQGINNEAGLIGGNGSVDINAENLTNQNGRVLAQNNLIITTQQGVDNTSGTLLALQDLTLKQSTANVNNTQGSIGAGKDLTVQATAIDNDGGTVAGNQDVKLNLQSLNGVGKAFAGRTLDISLTGDYTNSAGNELKANSSLKLTTTGAITNQGNLTAVNTMALKGANIVNDTGATIAAGAVDLSTPGDIINQGQINGDVVTTTSQNLNNVGTIFGDAVTINADKVTNINESAVIAATNQVNIYAGTVLENKDGAIVYSQGNIVIAGSGKTDDHGQYTDHVDAVRNYSATIEAEENIKIFANEINNNKGEFVAENRTLVATSQKKEVVRNDSEMFLYRKYKETIEEAVVTKDSAGAKILAGQNLMLRADTVMNESSDILAGGKLDTKANTVTNSAVTGMRYITRIGDEIKQTRYGSMTITPYYFQSTEQIYGTTANYGGGQAVSIQATNINNINVNPEGTPLGNMDSTLPTGQSVVTVQSAQNATDTNSVQVEKKNVVSVGTNTGTVNIGGTSNPAEYTFNLPNSGLFAVHQEPGSKYLVETDPRFTNYQNFISSDYMLEKLGINPEITQKRLGDGFYEQKLVRDQITQLTGRRYLEGYSSSEEQFKALLNNGTTYALEFDFKVGVALNPEQMAQLTSDIIWMEEKEVEGNKVLVPVVYLAHTNNMDLKPSGALIRADNIEINATGDLTNTSTIKATNSTSLEAKDIINDGGYIDGGQITQITAAQDIINRNGTIIGGEISLAAGRDIQNETIVSTVDRGAFSLTIVNQQADIKAQQNLTLKAGHDIVMTAGQASATGDLVLNAGHDLIMNSVESTERVSAIEWSGLAHLNAKSQRSTTTNITSNIQAGETLSIISQNDATLQGTQVSAGEDIGFLAGGNITITSVKDRVIDDWSVGNKHSDFYRHKKTDDETIVGSKLAAQGNVTVAAIQSSNTSQIADFNANHGDLVVEGSNISSEAGNIVLAADKDVTIKETTERHETFAETRTKDSGLFSSKTTITRDQTIAQYAIGSALSGDQVQISSGNDLIIQGSTVVSTNDVALTAANNVNITAAQETYDSEHYFYQKKSGLSASFSGGISIFAGTTSQESTTTEHTVNQVGSTVGSIDGNVTITAGKDATITGSDVIGQAGIDVTAQNITIDAATNTIDVHQTYEFKQTGLTISVGNTFTSKAGEAASAFERSQQVADDRLAALYDLKTYRAADKAVDEIKGNRALTNLTMTVGLGSTKQESETTTHITSSVGSSLSSSGTINLTATGSGTNVTDGDLNIIGSSVNGENVTLAAANDINLKSSADTMDSHTESSGKSAGFGVTTGIGKGNAGTSMYIEGSKSSGVIDETSTTYNETTITANNTLTIKSGRDTNLEGTQASGETVVADVGRDLNIISQQDTQTYHEENKSASAKVGTGGGSTASANKSNIDSIYQSVNEQTGIFAGTGGFDIEVEGNTDIKGAVIASEADAEKNRLSTGSLTYSDIENKAEYEAESVGVSVDTHKYKNTDENYKNKGVTPDIGTSATGEDSSTTHAAIAAGTIEVRNNPNMDLSNLSRDTQNAVNALDQIFDKQTVQEQQELSKMFGEEAYHQIHVISAKNGWDEGSPQKIALHAFVGAVMADMGGGDALSGAAGAGVNEAVQKELADHFKDNPDLHQWASYIVGSAASSVVGGNAQTGGSTAASGTKNNYYDFNIISKLAIEDGTFKPKGADVYLIEGSVGLDAIIKTLGVIVPVPSEIRDYVSLGGAVVYDPVNQEFYKGGSGSAGYSFGSPVSGGFYGLDLLNPNLPDLSADQRRNEIVEQLGGVGYQLTIATGLGFTTLFNKNGKPTAMGTGVGLDVGVGGGYTSDSTDSVDDWLERKQDPDNLVMD